MLILWCNLIIVFMYTNITQLTPDRASRRAAARTRKKRSRLLDSQSQSESLLRLKNASVGRILNLLMEKMMTKVMSHAAYGATLEAVYCYLMSHYYKPDSYVMENLDMEVYREMCEEIDRSVKRSNAARERAAKRKAAMLWAQRLALQQSMEPCVEPPCDAVVADVAAEAAVPSVGRSAGIRIVDVT